MAQRQQEGDYGLPRRPPARLAMLDKAKDGDGRETLLEDLRVESRKVQGRLKELLKQFRTEVEIYLRLMYKNKNQHRHSLYFRRMLQVRRDLRLLDYSALDETVEGFTKWTFSFKQSRVNVDQRNLDKDQVRSAMCTFLSATRILNQIDQPILAASTQILGLLSLSFFMSLGLTIFSTLARLRVLSQQLLFEFATVYNLLSVFSKEKPELSNPKTQLSVVPAEARRPPLPLHLECQWDGGKLYLTEIEPPTEVLVTSTEGDEAVPIATPLSGGSWFVDDRISLGVSKNLVTRLPIVGPKVSRTGVLRGADDRTEVKYDILVSAVTAREEPLRISEKAQSQRIFLENECQGAASTRQIFKDEPAVKVSVTSQLSEGATGIHMKNDEREGTASFVTKLSESNSSRADKEITPGQVTEASSGTKVLTTEERLIPVEITGATALDMSSAEPSDISGANVDDRSVNINRMEEGGSVSVSTGVSVSLPAGVSEHPSPDLLSTSHEDVHQRVASDKRYVPALDEVAHDASVQKDCDAKISPHASEDILRSETSQRAPPSCSDQVGPFKAASLEKGILSLGTAVESGVEFMERKDASNQGLTSAKVAKRAVAYISVLPPPENPVKRQEDDTQRSQAIEAGVAALDTLGQVLKTRVENGALESSMSAYGQGCSEDTSHQLPKAQGHSNSSSGASSEKEQDSSAPASLPDIASTFDKDKQSKLPGPVSATKRPMSYISVRTESTVQKKMKVDCSLKVIPGSVCAAVDPPVAPVSIVVEKDEDISVPVVSVDATSKNLRRSEVFEEPKCMPLERTSTNEASKTPESDFDTDTASIERREEMRAAPGSILGTERPAAEISESESLMEMMQNSKQEAAVNDKKLGAPKERVGQTRKNKRRKGNEGKGRALGTDELNDKAKRKEVNELFNMLLGGS